MSDMYLRKADYSDIHLLYNWANDPIVRSNSFDTHSISIEEHKAWFQKMMVDFNQIQYIMMAQEIPVGQIRFSIEGSEAEIDYSLSKEFRGCGYGKEIVQLGIQKIIQDRPEIRKLIGKVKPSSKASYACFLNNDFKEKYIALEYYVSNK